MESSYKRILSLTDHTRLAPETTADEIKQLCEDGMKYACASVCIPPRFVKFASEFVKGGIPICTVIGFPCGYQTTAVKVFETEQAVRDGADEIDMVIDIGFAKEEKYDEILNEIKAVRRACGGKILKVIIECCKLSREEKIKLCGIVSRSGADYIKTSTGFGGGGATLDDIKLMKENVSGIKIKAAGGIASFAEAKAFADAGADRIGASALVRIAKSE